LFPDYFEPYKACIPEAERGDMIKAYYKRLTGDDEEEKLKCAGAWSTWESSTVELIVNGEYIKKAENPKWALAFARIECHFFVNAGWMRDGQLIEEAYKVNYYRYLLCRADMMLFVRQRRVGICIRHLEGRRIRM
jgi:proline iminopeptidase